ncbi:hypothetical protein SAY87_007189 [Trapa incisa]|uniref:Seed maturation-like protein n=1 Tax=Trapa incisa TaxID=236973 RepID=A0AAN7K0T7_9MYRT|nr:hypothetical protein SAY87_007189 [Trapa incisa]
MDKLGGPTVSPLSSHQLAYISRYRDNPLASPPSSERSDPHMAASARATVISRLTGLSPRPSTLCRHVQSSFLLHFTPLIRRRNNFASSYSMVTCLSGGLSDDFVSTRKSTLDHGFSVIANMLMRIEPLDNSVISKGVSDSAKDSMKQTISTMLGLLPSDQFSVKVTVSKHPLHRLIISSIITGYTLWNAEYRISLIRNFDISSNSLKNMNSLEEGDASEIKGKSFIGSNASLQVEDGCVEHFGRIQVFGNLPPDALSYIQQLQSELHTVEEELGSHKQQYKQMEYGRESRNDLLEYLRSLDPDMVNELSWPSSVEVEEIIKRLVRNILPRFFKNEMMGEHLVDSLARDAESCEDGSDEQHEQIDTSRDYLAKLLFWCMLLGHHLRGLENRLQLSCVVGLL